MPNFTPIPTTPADVFSDVDAGLALPFKISTLIKVTKAPKIIHLNSDLLFT